MVAVALADASAGFNTQPPEGGWNTMRQLPITHLMFQHTAARRRLAGATGSGKTTFMFQHTAARRRLGE